MKLYHDVKIIFIDYINLIPVSQKNIPRFDQVAFLSRNIRVLILELEIPIIVLSQVSRSAKVVEPSLATLGESAALQWDADIEFFCIKRSKDVRGGIP
ncbi:DnaB-like helicase C-terminal domain-containing protein [Borreliella burgdorferi]|uniref:DnaB-like helicase C-terminal domain-containing protein n=1 Tax=Borreliella TaxID=64895 RepID=UPI0022AA77A2|nr:DnaB-like helicase C-terminal domain-containing protein [Borreliella burgdorferi]